MPKISGKWLFNKTLSEDGWADVASGQAWNQNENWEYVNYKVYTDDGTLVEGTEIIMENNYAWNYGKILVQSYQLATGYALYNFNPDNDYKFGWQFEGFRLFDFGEVEQEVTDRFYNYVIANAVPYGIQAVYERIKGAWVKRDAYERKNGAWVQVSESEG